MVFPGRRLSESGSVGAPDWEQLFKNRGVKKSKSFGIIEAMPIIPDNEDITEPLRENEEEEEAASQIQDSRDLLVMDAVEVATINRLDANHHTARICDFTTFHPWTLHLPDRQL